MNAYKQLDVGKSRSISTPGATASAVADASFLKILSPSRPLSVPLRCSLARSPPVSASASSSYLPFLPSVSVLVVSLGPYLYRSLWDL